jgi:hypothetical protein
MSEKKILIEIIGQDAEECANILSGIINAEFGRQPVKFNPQDQYEHKGTGKRLDPSIIGAIAGTISAGLAFPAAILTAIQIKDRLGKKESFERLIEKGSELKKIKRISKIRFCIGPIECEIEKASFAEISDLAS